MRSVSWRSASTRSSIQKVNCELVCCLQNNGAFIIASLCIGGGQRFTSRNDIRRRRPMPNDASMNAPLFVMMLLVDMINVFYNGIVSGSSYYNPPCDALGWDMVQADPFCFTWVYCFNGHPYSDPTPCPKETLFDGQGCDWYYNVVCNVP